jgi:PAS domain S-box-containing protein
MHNQIIKSEQTKFLWDHGREGIAILSEAGIIKAANLALCDMLNYTDIELIGMHFTEVTVSSDQEIDSIKFNQLIKGEISSYKMTKKWRTKCGKIIAGDLYVRRWIDDIFVYGSVMPMEPISSAIIGDLEAQKIVNEALGKWLRSLPAIALKNWKVWVVIALALTGSLGYEQLIRLIH